MNKGDNTQRILLLPGFKQNWIVRQFFHKISGYRKFITANFESTCVQTDRPTLIGALEGQKEV